MKDIGAGYIAEGMKTEGNQQITLVTITLPNSTNVYLCDDLSASVTALAPDDVTQVVYARAPITISNDMDINVNNEFPKLTMSINADPRGIIASYVKVNDGLRGCNICVIKTFKSLIGTAEEGTYREKSTFVVDASTISEQAVTFTLATGLELYGTSIPRRKYYKNFCPRKYISATDSDMTTNNYWTYFYCNRPDGTAAGCNRTINADDYNCEYFGNEQHFGAFPDIPRSRVKVSL